MKFRLRAGETADMLNQSELGSELDRQTTDFFRELARGFNTAPIDPQPQIPSGGDVQFPAVGEEPIGPGSGFLWRVTRISADGLAGSDALKIYKGQGPAGSIAGLKFVGTLTVASPTFTPGHGLLLRAGMRLVVTGTSLTATDEVEINGEAIECSELDAYKVLR